MSDTVKQEFIFSPFLEYDYGVEWVVEADEATKEFKEKYQKILTQLKSSPHYFHLKDFFREEVEEVLNSKLWDPANPFLLFSSLKGILSELEDLKLPIVPGLSYKQVQIAILKLILWKGFVFGEKEGKRWDEIRKEIEKEGGEGTWDIKNGNTDNSNSIPSLQNIAQFNQSALSPPFSSYKSSPLSYISASFPQEIEITQEVKKRNGIKEWKKEGLNGNLNGICSLLGGEEQNSQQEVWKKKRSSSTSSNGKKETKDLLFQLFQSWSQKKYYGSNQNSSPSLLLLSSTKWGEEERVKGGQEGKKLEEEVKWNENGEKEKENGNKTISLFPTPWPQVLSSFLQKLSSSLNNYSELIAKSKDKLLKDFLDNSRVFEVGGMVSSWVYEPAKAAAIKRRKRRSLKKI